MVHSRARGINPFTLRVIFFLLVIFKNFLKLTSLSNLSHKKVLKVLLCRVWVRLITAYLFCAREFRQNNTLALRFWCLSGALTLQVRALDASKSQCVCVILSKFTRQRKYGVINPWLICSFFSFNFSYYLQESSHHYFVIPIFHKTFYPTVSTIHKIKRLFFWKLIEQKRNIFQMFVRY